MQASRNCLVGENNNVKVADYSLALYTSSRKPSRTVVSIKWAAPELIVQQPMFTTKSDVWSFGKLLVGYLVYWIYITTTRKALCYETLALFSGLPTVQILNGGEGLVHFIMCMMPMSTNRYTDTGVPDQKSR